MGDKSSESAEVFKHLFGGFSGSLSVFTNNPYQRKNGEKAGSSSARPGPVEQAVERSPQTEGKDTGGNRVSGKELKLKGQVGETEGFDLGEQRKRKRGREGRNVEEVRKDAGINANNGKLGRKRKGEVIEKDTGCRNDYGSDILSRKEKRKDKKDESVGKAGRKVPRLLEPSCSHDGSSPPDVKVVFDYDDRKKENKGGDSQMKVKHKRGQGSLHEESQVSRSSPPDTLYDIEVRRVGVESGTRKQGECGVIGHVPSTAAKMDNHVKKGKGKMRGVAGETVEQNEGNTSRSGKRKKDDDIEMHFEKRMRGSGVVGAANSGSPRIQDVDRESQDAMECSHDRKKGKRKFMEEEEEGSEHVKRRSKEEREDDERKLHRTIFVGNLATAVKKKHLMREFSQYGKVETARLRSIPLVDTKMSRKAAVITGQLNESRSSLNAYVVFEEEGSAKAALFHNMKEFRGKHIRVDMATAPRQHNRPGSNSLVEYDRTRSIFIGNLPFDVEDEELYALFGTMENPEKGIEAIRVVRDPQTSIGKGFAFVLFKSKAGATAALGRGVVKLRDRRLRVLRMGTPQHRHNEVQLSKFKDGRAPDNKSSATYRISGGDLNAAAKGPFPWEGARSSKPDGRPGKWTLAGGKVSHAKGRKSGTVVPRSAGGPAPEKGKLMKRPAVAARKAAALIVKSGGVAGPKRNTAGNPGVKRKKGEKGKKGSAKMKKARRK